MAEEINNNFSLNLATEKDVASLLMLQEAFHKYSPPEKREYSFAYEITNDPFSEEDFRNIVSKNECVILIYGDIPVGYMLIDTCSETQGLKDYKLAINQLIEEEKMDEEMNSTARLIEVLNPSLYKDELHEVRWQMLASMIFYTREKYKGLCYVFFTNADTLMEKIGLGWKIAFDNGLYFFMVWEFSWLNNDQ
jgi:hypothetical protein